PEALTFYYIGECYEKLDEFDKAIDYFRKALNIDESLADAWVAMGECYNSKENFPAAIRYISKGLKIDPENSDYLLSMAYSQQSAGLISQAIISYERSLKYNPEDISIYLDFSALFDEQQQYREAIEILDQGLNRLDQHPELLCRKAVYLAHIDMNQEFHTFVFTNLTVLQENKQLMYQYDPDLEFNTRFRLHLLESLF
ncbi:MAG TPA: hypothetical protein DCL86_09770, partial [Bacteroidales bacterium]|nr:hypothetical protein [Bacteroidales bacterium]